MQAKNTSCYYNKFFTFCLHPRVLPPGLNLQVWATKRAATQTLRAWASRLFRAAALKWERAFRSEGSLFPLVAICIHSISGLCPTPVGQPSPRFSHISSVTGRNETVETSETNEIHFFKLHRLLSVGCEKKGVNLGQIRKVYHLVTLSRNETREEG